MGHAPVAADPGFGPAAKDRLTGGQNQLQSGVCSESAQTIGDSLHGSRKC